MSALGLTRLDRVSDTSNWSEAWSIIGGRVIRTISRIATLYDLCPFDLKLRVLLQLPRFRWIDLYDEALIDEEIDRVAKKTVELQRGFQEWSRQETVDSLEKEKTEVSSADETTANIIHERFHYIGSSHRGRHFALCCSGRNVPAALATVSGMDVQKLRNCLPHAQSKTLLLSRVFAFRWAPRNTLSYLLGAVTRRLKREGEFSSVVTWINPNLGFQAAGYRAANWRYWRSESATYRYLSGNYISARQLFCARLDSSSDVTFSQFRLAPFEVWYYRMDS